jgi:hypothetical protein
MSRFTDLFQPKQEAPVVEKPKVEKVVAPTPVVTEAPKSPKEATKKVNS